MISRRLMLPAAALLAAPSLAKAGGIVNPTRDANLIDFLQAGTGAVKRSVRAKLWDIISVKDFGAVGDGATDDTAAIQAAIDSFSTTSGGLLFFPAGTYKVTDTITVEEHRTHLLGSGKWTTTISFNPASAKACFKFQRAVTSEILYQCSIRGFSFTGGGTQQKIALDLHEPSEFHVSEIAVFSNWTGNSGSSSTPSIGIRTYGHEAMRFQELDIYADRPIHIVRSPNYPTLSADHFHFTDCLLAPQVSTESSYLIDGDVGMANFTLDGYQAWVGGKYGVRFLSGTVPAQIQSVHFSNFRFEQPDDNTGYAVEWQASTLSLLFESGSFGGSGSPTNGGAYLRNVRAITFLNAIYSGQGVALNVDTTCDDIQFINTFFQDSSTVSMTGFEEQFGLNKINALSPIAPNSFWRRTASAARSIRINGVWTDIYAADLANAAIYRLPLSGSGALKAAFVEVAAYNSTGPVEAGANFLVTGSSAIKLSGTANTAVGNVGGSLCLFWQNISTIDVLNNLGSTVRLVVRTVYNY